MFQLVCHSHEHEHNRIYIIEFTLILILIFCVQIDLSLREYKHNRIYIIVNLIVKKYRINNGKVSNNDLFVHFVSLNKLYCHSFLKKTNNN